MGITPTKRRSGGKKKTAPAGAPTPEQISKLLTVWLGKMPPEQAKRITTGAPIGHPPQFQDEVASWSALMMHATNYAPHQWHIPPFFASTRMGRSIAWLQALPQAARLDARESAVEILQAAWPKVEAALLNADLRLHTIPDLWTPEEEFGPLDAPAPYLPSWRVEDEDPAVAAVAKAAEEFAIYSLLVTWLNDQLNLSLLDLQTCPF